MSLRIEVHLHSGCMLVLKIWVLRRMETGVSREKPLCARVRTNNKLNQCTPQSILGLKL